MKILILKQKVAQLTTKPQYILLLRILTVILAHQFYTNLFIYIFLYKKMSIKDYTRLFYINQNKMMSSKHI